MRSFMNTVVSAIQQWTKREISALQPWIKGEINESVSAHQGEVNTRFTEIMNTVNADRLRALSLYPNAQMILPKHDNWNIGYGNGRFVAISRYDNAKAYSDDGFTWYDGVHHGSTCPTTYDIAYGNGRFVAVGSSSGLYSDDGVNWFMMNMPRSCKAVAYGNGRFVAISDYSNRIVYSDDGINWTEISNVVNSKQDWASIAYGDGKFVIGGTTRYYDYSGHMGYSTDGVSWYKVDNDPRLPPQSLAYGNGIFVGVGNGSGNTYTEVGTTIFYDKFGSSGSGSHLAQPPGGSNGWLVAFGNGLFVAVDKNGTRSAYSVDGAVWVNMSLQDSVINEVISQLKYCGDRFVAIPAKNCNMLWYSFDGINWTAQSSVVIQNNGRVNANLYNAITEDASEIKIRSTTDCHRQYKITVDDSAGVSLKFTDGVNTNDIMFRGEAIPTPTTRTTVGQTIVVKSVNASGVPTEWETVDPFIMTDENTGEKYRLTIVDGNLVPTPITT